MQKHIYHVHDVCCKHATLTLEKVVSYALEHGYKEIYYTEHCPISVKCDYQVRRATQDELVDLNRRIQMYNKRYNGKLHIYFGYEAEFNKANRWYFEKLARDPLCQYLILGCHFFGDLFKAKLPLFYTKTHTFYPKQIGEFLEMNEAGIKSGLFSWLAHPEIFLNSYTHMDKHSISACKQIIKLAKKFKLPLGFNVNFNAVTKSPFHYPSKHFWKYVAGTNIPVIIESDAHDLEKITIEWLDQAKKLAYDFGLKNNLVEKVKINWLPKKPLLVLYEKSLLDCFSKKMLQELKAKKVKFKEIDGSCNILLICDKYKIHPVWTLALVNTSRLYNSVKKTSAFVIADKKGSDLSLKQLKKLSYKEFMKYFIKPV